MANLESKLNELFSDAMRTQRLVGLSVGLIRGNEPLYVAGFGDAKAGGPVTSRTVFHTASVTKSFVSIAVLQLAERGLLQLDDPVVKHVPYFTLREPASQKITLRQLLSHTSGFPHPPNITSYHWDQPEFDDGALERYVRSLASLPLRFAPGEKFSYSDTGFDVLGEVIAKVANMPFETYMSRHVLHPIGMTSSSFCAPRGPDEVLAWPHVLNERGEPTVSSVYPYHRAHAPSSTLASNILDLNSAASVHLAFGATNDGALLSRPSYEEMWRPVTQVNVQTWIGLGWFGRNSGDELQMFVSGTDLGFATHLLLYPRRGLSVAILTNSEWAKPWKLATIAAQIVLATI